MSNTATPRREGFTLIEVLISLSVIAVLFIGVYQLIILSLGMANNSKLNVEAVEIANQKMERIMNMPYDQVGVVNGIPNGPIVQTETIDRAGRFTVSTYIRFNDDPFDGTIGSTTKPDLIGVDYKIATVKVAWQSRNGTKSVTVFSKIIPRTMETLKGYGLLEILVNDSDGQPIPGANVHVYNPVATTTVVDVSYPTDAYGYLYLPAWASALSYQITASLPGYSFEQTYSTSTGNPNPLRKHLSVIESQKTSNSFTIDRLARLNIRTMTQGLTPAWQTNAAMSGFDAVNGHLSAGENGNFYYTWQKTTASSSNVALHKYDHNGNPSWGGALVIPGTDHAYDPAIKGDPGGGAVLVWRDDRTGDYDIRVQSFDQTGATAWGPLRVNSDAGVADQIQPAIGRREGIAGATSTIIWSDARNGNFDIYLMLIDQAGNRLWGADLQVTTSTRDESKPDVAVDGTDGIYAAWVEDNGLDQDVYLARYDFSGTPLWAAPLPVAVSADKEYDPSIAADEAGNIYVGWTTEAALTLSIRLAKFASDGTKQWEIDPRAYGGASDSYHPAVAVRGNIMAYIAWADNRFLDDNIYVQKIDPAGTPVWSTDQRLNKEVVRRVQNSPAIAIDASDRRLALWQGVASDSEYDIWSVKFAEPDTVSAVPNQPIRITGSKLIGTLPDVVKVDIATTTDASGNRSLSLEYDGGGYAVSLIAASTTYSLVDSEPSQPVPLGPGETIDLILNLD